MAKIAVVLLTYNRLPYALKTVTAALKNLESNDHSFKWHIASDGDNDAYTNSIMAEMRACMLAGEITTSNSERGGYGKNYNLAMQTAHADCEYVLPLEDDWVLTRGLNLDGVIRDMTQLGIGCARMGYIGYTQEVRGTLRYGDACGHWFEFDAASPEPHVFAGHPRIEAVEWSRKVGPWNEGLLPGATEFEVAHRPAARVNVAWPLDMIRPTGGLFAHIGAERSY